MAGQGPTTKGAAPRPGAPAGASTSKGSSSNGSGAKGSGTKGSGTKGSGAKRSSPRSGSSAGATAKGSKATKGSTRPKATKPAATGAKPAAKGSGRAPAAKSTKGTKRTKSSPAARSSAAPATAATKPAARPEPPTDPSGRRRSGKQGRSPVSAPVVVGTRRPIGGRAPAAWVERLFAPPNVDGPRVRTGILWFLLAVPAVWFGSGPTALLFGLVALVAALQSGQAWNRAGYRTSRLVAAGTAVAMPAAALLPRPAVAGLVLVALPVLAYVAALSTPARRRRTSALAAAGATVSSAAPAGIAAAAMVVVAGQGRAPALTLLALVCAYDMGSFVFGAESPYPSHGILGGVICTMVAVAPIWVFRLQPFDGRIETWIFGGLVATVTPLGPVVASAALPTAATWVPALRRLDAYIVAAPVWVAAMWSYLA